MTLTYDDSKGSLFADRNYSARPRVLNAFKGSRTDEIPEHLGSMQQFDEMVSDLKAHEAEIASMAVKQYGSITYIEVTDKKYGNGASEFIGHAIMAALAEQ